MTLDTAAPPRHQPITATTLSGDKLVTVYVTIGNTDNTLTQQQWAAFIRDVRTNVTYYATTLYGEWHALPDKPWQTCCWGFTIAPAEIPHLQAYLNGYARRYGQESIAWATAAVTLLTGT